MPTFFYLPERQRSDSPRYKRKYRGKVLWAMSHSHFQTTYLCSSNSLLNSVLVYLNCLSESFLISELIFVLHCFSLKMNYKKELIKTFSVNLIATSEKELSFTCTFAEMSPVFLEFQSALWHAGSWLCSFLSKFLQVKKWEMFGRKSASFNLI